MIKALLLMQYLGKVIWTTPIKRTNVTNMNDTSNQIVVFWTELVYFS